MSKTGKMFTTTLLQALRDHDDEILHLEEESQRLAADLGTAQQALEMRDRMIQRQAKELELKDVEIADLKDKYEDEVKSSRRKLQAAELAKKGLEYRVSSLVSQIQSKDHKLLDISHKVVTLEKELVRWNKFKSAFEQATVTEPSDSVQKVIQNLSTRSLVASTSSNDLTNQLSLELCPGGKLAAGSADLTPTLPGAGPKTQSGSAQTKIKRTDKKRKLNSITSSNTPEESNTSQTSSAASSGSFANPISSRSSKYKRLSAPTSSGHERKP